jgi:NADH:ubiquinone reductase (H+-translocating)
MEALASIKKSSPKDGMKRKPHVVIVGAGFGGLQAAKRLRRDDITLTIIDRRNHHLFQPLLYQVATAALAPSNIAVPIRPIFRNDPNVKVLLSEVKSVTPQEQLLELSTQTIHYDYLILAAGAKTSYFGHDEWARDAPGLKSLEDAVEIRKRVLSAFELAERCPEPEEQRALMTFIVIGGGPTGVEMAGAIAEMARFTLAKDFREINPGDATIILAEGGDRLLPGLDPQLSHYARRALERLGVDVRTNTFASSISAEQVRLGQANIPARTIIWAAGVQASSLGRTLGVELDRMGRVPVKEDLTLPGHREIQIIGDLARFQNPDGSILPGVSPVAIQQGKHAARNISRMISGKKTLPFRYWNKGMMATIGRNSAVADIRLFRLTGFLAWLAWVFLHIMYLVGFRNRVVTFFEWAYAYFSFSKGSRLITWSLVEAEQKKSSQKEEASPEREK